MHRRTDDEGLVLFDGQGAGRCIAIRPSQRGATPSNTSTRLASTRIAGKAAAIAAKPAISSPNASLPSAVRPTPKPTAAPVGATQLRRRAYNRRCPVHETRIARVVIGCRDLHLDNPHAQSVDGRRLLIRRWHRRQFVAGGGTRQSAARSSGSAVTAKSLLRIDQPSPCLRRIVAGRLRRRLAVECWTATRERVPIRHPSGQRGCHPAPSRSRASIRASRAGPWHSSAAQLPPAKAMRRSSSACYLFHVRTVTRSSRRLRGGADKGSPE